MSAADDAALRPHQYAVALAHGHQSVGALYGFIENLLSREGRLQHPLVIEATKALAEDVKAWAREQGADGPKSEMGKLAGYHAIAVKQLWERADGLAKGHPFKRVLASANFRDTARNREARPQALTLPQPAFRASRCG